MTASRTLPLLFLDVDGVLLPFGAPPRQDAPRQVGTAPEAAGENPLVHRIDPRHGPRLAALPCEPVWATTWGAGANEYIAPLVGLPQLEVVDWPEPSGTEERDARSGLHGKTRALVHRAADRPFAWVDDEITETDRTWVSAAHRGPALLLRVDPSQGLTDAGYATLRAWLRETTGTPTAQDSA